MSGKSGQSGSGQSGSAGQGTSGTGGSTGGAAGSSGTSGQSGAGGATAGTSGQGGAGGTSGNGGAAGAATGCAGQAVCDDFEGASADGPPDATRWDVVSPNCAGTGKLAIDATQAHSGQRSVRIDGKGGYCNHVFFSSKAPLSTLGSVIYGRFYLRLGGSLGDGHVTFLAMRDTADSGGKDLRMGGQSKILMWNRESDDATLPSLSPAGIAQSVQPAPGTWRCVEFMVDGAQGQLQTWVDGAAVAGLQVDASSTPDIDMQWHSKSDWKPSLVDLRLGWESYAGQDMTLWFDDVAVDTKRVGCQ